MKQQACKGQHEGHLCVLASKGELARVGQLAREPKFICFNCGRVAACEENLCNPMSLA